MTPPSPTPLLTILAELQNFPANDHRSLSKLLTKLFDHTRKDPLQLWGSPDCVLLADAMLKYLALEISDDEESLIYAAHISYFYYDRALAFTQPAPAIYYIHKQLVILTEEFADYFRHTVARLYSGSTQKIVGQQLNDALHVADTYLQMLSSRVLQQLQDLVPENQWDGYLLELEQHIATTFTPTQIETDGQLLHKVLIGYIAKQCTLGKDFS
ncbi:MAG: hypothetical protein RIS47_662 [Bacteroidota bacterium]|jgi:hypothetical protein